MASVSIPPVPLGNNRVLALKAAWARHCTQPAGGGEVVEPRRNG
jgi:hypothetical protein